MRMPWQEPEQPGATHMSIEHVEYRMEIDAVDPALLASRERAGRPYAEWDRSEWVGEGQEPADASASPPRLEPEVRWTKWEWIGEGQGAAGPNRGAPAAAMPDGENGFSGHRHNPGMAHWGGRRPLLRSRGREFDLH